MEPIENLDSSTRGPGLRDFYSESDGDSMSLDDPEEPSDPEAKRTSLSRKQRLQPLNPVCMDCSRKKLVRPYCHPHLVRQWIGLLAFSTTDPTWTMRDLHLCTKTWGGSDKACRIFGSHGCHQLWGLLGTCPERRSPPFRPCRRATRSFSTLKSGGSIRTTPVTL